MNTLSLGALGTNWWITIKDTLSSSKWDKLVSHIKDEIFQFNDLYSRFLDSSLIGQLNKFKTLTQFDQEFLDLILYSQILKQNTFGYFDISIGNTLNEFGYTNKFAMKLENSLNQIQINSTSSKQNDNLGKLFELNLISSDFEIKDKLVDFNKIRSYFSSLEDNIFDCISDSKISITKNSSIDFGGIGKGWLVDKICKLLQNNQVQNFTINAGGDIYSTEGLFYLENPSSLDEYIGSIEIKNQAIACSASNRRKFSEINHHLINPHTKHSSSDYLAVFTQAKTTLEADVASTVLFVSPRELHTQLQKILNVEYMIIFPDQTYAKSIGYCGLLNN